LIGRNKILLRNSLILQQQELSEINRKLFSDKICTHLISDHLWESIHSIISFWPMNNEPDLRPLLLQAIQDGKTVGLVRTKGSPGSSTAMLEVRKWDGHPESLEPHSRLSLLQPSRELSLIDNPAWHSNPQNPQTIVIVPGVAFTLTGDRLGHGGGYYDNFLSACPGLLRIGTGFEFQIVDTIPVDTWDQPIDLLLTENRFVQTNRRLADHE